MEHLVGPQDDVAYLFDSGVRIVVGYAVTGGRSTLGANGKEHCAARVDLRDIPNEVAVGEPDFFVGGGYLDRKMISETSSDASKYGEEGTGRYNNKMYISSCCFFFGWGRVGGLLRP